MVFFHGLSQKLCEFIRKEQIEDHLVEENFLSYTYNTYAHAAARYRERVVKATRNRSFHPEKLCCTTFDWVIHPCRLHWAAEKMLLAPPTLISLRRRRRNSKLGVQDAETYNRIERTRKTLVFARARKVAFYRKYQRQPQ